MGNKGASAFALFLLCYLFVGIFLWSVPGSWDSHFFGYSAGYLIVLLNTALYALPIFIPLTIGLWIRERIKRRNNHEG